MIGGCAPHCKKSIGAVDEALLLLSPTHFKITLSLPEEAAADDKTPF